MSTAQFTEHFPVMQETDNVAREELVEGDETVQLEACSPTTPNEEETDIPESWTSYEISKPAKTQTPQSPVNSEITPEDASKESSDNSIRISVSNPKKTEEVTKLGIRSSFVSYSVQTETTLDDFPFTKRTVWRRFRDFDSLHRLLRENHRGFVVPPLPSKNYLESKRGTEAFIKERQMDLNRFLNQIILHPVLYNTEEMKVFLGSPEDLTSSHDWYNLSETAKKATSTGASELDNAGDFMIKEVTSFFKKVSNTLKGDTFTSHTITETEQSLQEMIPQVKQLELILTDLVEKSVSFGNLFEEVGEDLGLLGRIWVTIARFEEDFVKSLDYLSSFTRELTFVARIMQKTGFACVRIQQISKKQATVLRGRLNPVSEELSILPAVLMSLQDRTLALRSVYQIQGELETQRKALDVLKIESSKKLGGMAGFGVKSAALSQEISNSIEEVEKRNENYDSVTERNLTELERIRINRHRECLELALNVAISQQDHYETTALIWTNLAVELSTLIENET